MKQLILFGLFLSSTLTYSQTCSSWKWAERIKKNYDINGGNNSNEIVLDSEANLLIAGRYSTDSILFNNGVFLYDSISSYYNAFIAKYDSTGAALWAVDLPASHEITITSITTVPDDNVYLNGHFRADTLFLGPDTLINQGIYNHFVSKLDPNGNFIWSRGFGGLSGWGDSRSLAVKNNIVYASGNMYQNGGFDIDTASLPGNFYNKSFIARFDTAVNFIDIFTTETTGGHDNLRGMSVDNNGNMYITGQYSNDLTIDTASFPVLTGTTRKIFVAKLNSNFEVQYTHYSESSGFDYAQTILSDANGNCYVGGVSLEDTMIIAGNTVYNYNDFFGMFLGKFDPNGNPEWLIHFGGSNSGSSDEKMMRLAWNEDDKLMAFANFESDSLFIGQDTLYPQAGNTELWLLKIDPADGNMLEEYELREIGDQGMGGIATGPNNSVGVCGNHKGEYGLIIGNDTLIHVNDGANASVSFLALYNSFGVNVSTDTEVICSNDSTIIYGTENLNSYQWFLDDILITGADSSMIWASQPGNYHMVGEYNSGCLDTSSVINLITNISFSSITEIACDSYLSPSGKTFTTSGTHLDTIANAMGCDSIITIDLTINLSTSSSQTVSACDTYSWQGSSYTSSGQYVDSLQTVSGCDSILVLNLTINTVDAAVTQSGQLLTANQSGASYQWLNCNGMTLITDSINQLYFADMDGDYGVIVTMNGCTDTSTCYTVAGVGLEPHGSTFLPVVYPNPTNGKLNISLDHSFAQITLGLTDVSGGLILHKSYIEASQLVLNLAYIPAGIYFLSIKAEDQQAIMKLAVD